MDTEGPPATASSLQFPAFLKQKWDNLSPLPRQSSSSSPTMLSKIETLPWLQNTSKEDHNTVYLKHLEWQI
jgi:hypothetical protein